MESSDRGAPLPTISVLDGVAIVVGIVVGIGIFKTPPLVAANVGSETAFIFVWVLGGLAMLVGALCYAELAAAYPHAGGEYNFLSRAFGRRVAIMFGWARGTVIQTGAIAVVAFVLGDYANQILPLREYGPSIYAAVAIAILSGINLSGTPQSKSVQVVLTVLTLIAIVAIIVASLFVADRDQALATTSDAGSSGAFGMAMVLVLLTYGGWNEAAYLSAEIRDVRRNMVRILIIGTGLIALLYCLFNAALLASFGLDGLRQTEAVGADLMRLVAGDAGAVALSLVVVAAALSTLNATIFTGARVYYALGQDLPVIGRIGIWNSRGDTPANAILLQGAIALALVGFGAITRDGFQAMVDYTAPVFWGFLLLVGISLFVLRRREPHRRLPFRVPLYPLIPALFCATCIFMLYASLAYTGAGSLIGIVVLCAGLPLLLLPDQQGAPAPAE
jgi:basic amino acid/polyamine antiporter, APA family